MAFTRAGALGEYIEDKLRAVDYLDSGDLADIALLGGGEVLADDHHIRLRFLHPQEHLIGVSRPDVEPWVRVLPPHVHLIDNLQPRAFHQQPEFLGVGLGLVIILGIGDYEQGFIYYLDFVCLCDGCYL